MKQSENRVALVTGSGKRIGAAIAGELHRLGFNVVIHFNQSQAAAEALAMQLNQVRAQSAVALRHDVRDVERAGEFIERVLDAMGRLDVLVNNASSFYPTAVGEVTVAQWDELFGSNCKGAFFLSQAARPALQAVQGTIINITDIHAHSPLAGYSIYCMAKAALAMMTRSLAKEFAPDIRVNAVAPGAIAWPQDENELSAELKQHIIERTALKRSGEPQNIADAVAYLVNEAHYMTGQVIRVAGGRT